MIGYTELYKGLRAILERPLTSLLPVDQQCDVPVISSVHFTVLTIKVEDSKEPGSEYNTFIVDTGQKLFPRAQNLNTLHLQFVFNVS